MRGKLWMAVALCPALMASQCVEPVRVQLEPADPPAFQFTYRGDVLTVLQSFQVRTCPHDGNRVVWRIGRNDAPLTQTEPLRIAYGHVPRGYREARAAEPLRPGGCYETGAVAVEQHPRPRGTLGGVRFRVLPNRQLVAGWPGGLGLSSQPFRQINRAAVDCDRGYRRARTEADRDAVDAREHAVLEARVSCAWLRTHWPDLMERPASTERGLLGLLGLAGLAVAIYFLGGLLPDSGD